MESKITKLTCPNCKTAETDKNLFPGIFMVGGQFFNTEQQMVALYSCNKCGTVICCNDYDYIIARKKLYKEEVKRSAKFK